MSTKRPAAGQPVSGQPVAETTDETTSSLSETSGATPTREERILDVLRETITTRGSVTQADLDAAENVVDEHPEGTESEDVEPTY